MPADNLASIDAACAEWEERRGSDLADYWPKSELPYGFMTHMNNGGIPNHGYTHCWTMANPRQLLVLSQLLRSISERCGKHDWHTREFVLGAYQQSLAALELFVHLPISARSLALVAFAVGVPDGVKIEALAQGRLPRVWREEPAPEETQRIGSAWFESGDTLLLRVPSVVVPTEHNYVMNPTHRDYAALKISLPKPFSFDPRMWK